MIAFFKIFEVFRCQRIANSNLLNIRTIVINPNLLRGFTLREEDDIRLDTWRIGSKGSYWQSQDCMKVTVFHQQLTDFLACRILEQHVIGNHYAASSSGLENRYHMLNKVELFVGSLYREV